jgi:hypothetical protein
MNLGRSPLIHWSLVYGGTGGSGGQGGEHDGPGGAGEAPNMTFSNSKVYLTNPEDPSMLFYGL